VKAKLLVVVGALAIQGCGTMAYTPTEWSIKQGVIPPFNVAGSVSVVNAQPSTEEAIVYSYGGTKLASNYNAITAMMAAQVEGEIRKNGTARGGEAKKIELKVTYLRSTYIAMFWKSTMTYEARLGNGEVLTKTVKHGSGDLRQDLNGCVAEGVIHLLKDQKVIEYLGR